jgi:hypothetical protein
MESPVLGVVLDSSVVITAERKGLPFAQLVEAIQTAYGEVEASLSPITYGSRTGFPSAELRSRHLHRGGLDLSPGATR